MRLTPNLFIWNSLREGSSGRAPLIGENAQPVKGENHEQKGVVRPRRFELLTYSLGDRTSPFGNHNCRVSQKIGNADNKALHFSLGEIKSRPKAASGNLVERFQIFRAITTS